MENEECGQANVDRSHLLDDTENRPAGKTEAANLPREDGSQNTPAAEVGDQPMRDPTALVHPDRVEPARHSAKKGEQRFDFFRAEVTHWRPILIAEAHDNSLPADIQLRLACCIAAPEIGLFPVWL
jgi:hypothetical protein